MIAILFRRAPMCAVLMAAASAAGLGGAQAAAPGRAQTGPSGNTVLQAMLRETLKLRAEHAGGSVQGPGGVLSVSGDCAGLVRRVKKVVQLDGIKVMSWVHGFLRHAGKTTSIDVHLIELQTGANPPKAWSRSPSSGNRWHVAGRGAGVAEVYSPQVCLPLYARSSLSGTSLTWNNVGAATVDGHSAWQIQANRTAGITHEVTSLYIDSTTYELLRYGGLQTDTHAHTQSRTMFDYSQFNEKLSISAPKIGATRP
jgi:hypothetical protein